MNGRAVAARLPSRKPISLRLKKLFLNNWQLYVLILPAVVATFIFNYIPMYGVQIAFRNYKARLGILGSSWVGLKYFRTFMSTPLFFQMLKNTLLISVFNLALFPLNVIVALMINELRSIRFKRAVQMISYAPHFMSVVVVCGMIRLFFGRKNGVVNNLLEMLGQERIDFLLSAGAFRPLYVLSGVWQDIGWGTIIYLAALANVSQEQVEAAYIDGADKLRIVLHINIPYILPTAIILFIMAAGKMLSVGYEKILLLQNSLNMESSQVFSTYVYNMGIGKGEYSLSTAVDLFNCVTNIIILTIVNGISRLASGVSLW